MKNYKQKKNVEINEKNNQKVAMHCICQKTNA